MTAYTVDIDAVLAATNAAKATAERIQSESAAMMNQLVQLQSSWTGAAAASFHACVDQWRAAQAQVEQALGSISLALGNAATNYADTERYAASLFR
jgi:early secretory antigenic target protein ESAT-6